ncbi:MAG: flagellar assembly peptidoglycan hydrolase FlgJ [Pigmentiphaga sp.]|nr:flagellar assembly peptidoglycan hydrolase FlgJ [Pigmentiphaga sp.]
MDAMRGSASIQAGLAADARSLEGLKQRAREDQSAAARQAARQMEAYFAQMLIGQMRKTSMAGEGPIAKALSGSSNDLFRNMLDQQLAQNIAGIGPNGQVSGQGGLGIASMLEQQLTKKTVPAQSLATSGSPLSMSTLALARADDDGQRPGVPVRAGQDVVGMLGTQRRIQNGKFASQVASFETGSAEAIRAEFVGKFLPAARHAEAKTGIPAAFMLGQAALESGWGRREILDATGQTSHNLFGIKATGWSGKVVHAVTTEYENGVAQRVREPFRAYDSYEHAFEDYARLLSSSPRYGKVAKAATVDQFADGLQQAGYATDPAYANKLRQVIRSALDVMF